MWPKVQEKLESLYSSGRLARGDLDSVQTMLAVFCACWLWRRESSKILRACVVVSLCGDSSCCCLVVGRRSWRQA